MQTIIGNTNNQWKHTQSLVIQTITGNNQWKYKQSLKIQSILEAQSNLEGVNKKTLPLLDWASKKAATTFARETLDCSTEMTLCVPTKQRRTTIRHFEEHNKMMV
uniref:Uncharacterized protein n=1 Tax=Cacopsylla melanoneura TaxID=428564 RepID=A0A8D8W6V7_9HEMI